MKQNKFCYYLKYYSGGYIVEEYYQNKEQAQLAKIITEMHHDSQVLLVEDKSGLQLYVSDPSTIKRVFNDKGNDITRDIFGQKFEREYFIFYDTKRN